MHRSGIVFGIALLLAAAPAAAVVKVATFTGQIASGGDYTGHFIAAGGDLTGLAYKLTFRFDTSLGVRRGNPGFFDYLGSGELEGVPTAFATAITINGVTEHITGTYSAYAQIGIDLTQYYAEDYFNDGVTYSDVFVEHSDTMGWPNPSIETSVGPLLQSSGVSSFQILKYDILTGVTSDYVFADLGPDSTYTLADAVPDAAIWTLMIAGFGLIGTRMRAGRVFAAARR